MTCDLGTDQVITYDLDSEGKLSKLYTYHSQPGAGSRHIIFHNHYKIAYLICELNSTIEVLIYDGVGEFERMQVISTLPDGYKGFNGTAAIRLSKMVNTSMLLTVVMILSQLLYNSCGR